MSKRSASDGQQSNKKQKVEEHGSNSSANDPLPFIPQGFQLSRARLMTRPFPSNGAPHGDCVVLWMSRDQRAHDNHAVHYAQLAAQSKGVPLKVVFNLVPTFLEATLRQYSFMIGGLKEVEASFRSLDIPFYLLMGNPVENILSFITQHSASMLVTDFSPLRVPAAWVKGVANALDQMPDATRVPLIQVDAHNIVPCWVASPKLEYSARTFRSKVNSKIPEYLTVIPPPARNPPDALRGCNPVDWEAAFSSLQINRDVKEVGWIRPGAVAAEQMLDLFIAEKLKDYGDKRNDPNKQLLSNLSPYAHFGQIGMQKVILKVKQSKKGGSSVDSFIEEAVVRRELTDNFCYCKPALPQLTVVLSHLLTFNYWIDCE